MATLTKAMLDDLHKGCAAISMLPYTGGVALAGLDFSNADQVFTEQDTFNLSPDDSTTEDYKIDQYDEIIDSYMENGDWKMTGNIPSTSVEIFDYFFEKGEDINTGQEVKGQGGKEYLGKGYKEAKSVEVSVLIESKSRKTAIVLGHVIMTLNPPAIENHSKPAYAKITGKIVANGNHSKFAVLKAKP